jgi:hypothetical protein
LNAVGCEIKFGATTYLASARNSYENELLVENVTTVRIFADASGKFAQL